MEKLTRIKPILGTYVSISIAGETTREKLIEITEAGYKEIYRIHELMSFHEVNSEITKLNLGAFKRPIQISTDTLKVISTALEISKLSNGIFDISCGGALVKQKKLPDHGFTFNDESNWNDIQLRADKIFFSRPLLIDVSGIAKGYAVDKAHKRIEYMLSELGDRSEICINAGGDLKQTPWQNKKIKIQELCNPSINNHFVDMRDSCMATSSGEHGSMIIKNGKNICKETKSVSVFASSCMIADALTKVLYTEPMATINYPAYKSCLIVENGNEKWLR